MFADDSQMCCFWYEVFFFCELIKKYHGIMYGINRSVTALHYDWSIIQPQYIILSSLCLRSRKDKLGT